MECVAGYISVGTGNAECSACPAGKYSGVVGATECSSCPSGEMTSAEGEIMFTLLKCLTYKRHVVTFSSCRRHCTRHQPNNVFHLL